MDDPSRFDAPTSQEGDEPVRLSYGGSAVPWWVFAMWLAFFLFAAVYMFRNALPSIQRMMNEGRFDTFPF